MGKEFATSKAQDMVLAALGITGIETYSAAEDLFKQIGISVTPVRQGRTSIPSVTILDNAVGGWTAYGDGDVSDVSRTRVNLHALAEWVTNPAMLPTITPVEEVPAIDGAAIQAAHEQEKRDAIDRRYADGQRRKDQRHALFVQNATLRQHGYTWHKMQGMTDDDPDEWTLFAPDGHVVTVSEAFAAIGGN